MGREQDRQCANVLMSECANEQVLLTLTQIEEN